MSASPDWMRRALGWVTRRMAQPRIIHDRAGTSAYLSRHYVSGAPRMPDGSEPFDGRGDPRPGVQFPERIFGVLPHVYLHHFHRSDDDEELHNHPWTWAVSVVLVGGYREERRDDQDDVRARVVRPGSLNVIRSDDFHRVDLLEHDAWSLFIAGPRAQGWGFWSRTTGEFTPWREFVSRARGSAEERSP